MNYSPMSESNYEENMILSQPELLENFTISLKKEMIDAEVFTSGQLAAWPDESRDNIKTEIENIISSVFHGMPEKDRKGFVEKFFTPLETRQAILLKNANGRLIAAALYDYREIQHEGKAVKAVYIIIRAIRTEYQGSGLGQRISSEILTGLSPDILMVNCYQSPSLHSWIRLAEKGRVSGFKVWPRLEYKDGEEVLISVPFRYLGFVLDVFTQMFPYSPERLKEVIRNFTVLGVRQNDHDGVYDFNPWKKDGTKDKLAEALGAGDKDGVLVIFRKIKAS